MLQFFRKHQKVIFLFTTIAIVISFVFFGTYSTLRSQGPKMTDEEVTKLLDGSSLKKSQVIMMARFLSANLEDSRGEKHTLINLFNDGVLEKDILGTPLGKQLARQYIAECSEDVQQRWKQAVAYKPYVHPQVTFISAESIWTSFEPSLIDVMARIKKNQTSDATESFSLLCDAYLKQRRVPAEMMRRILFYQQNQASWAAKDPKLENTDLSLFGFHNAEEWLGSKYIELAGQFILNSAVLAKQNGYSVSKTEARASLLENLSRGMKLMSEQSLTPEEVRNAFYQQLRILGLDEMSCVELWQNVLLFRKLFQNAEKIVHVDPRLVEEHYKLAKKISVIDLYELPPVLRAVDFRSLMKLQLYIDSISTPKARGDILAIPKEVLSLQEIEKKAPELVQKGYVVEFSEVTKQDVLSSISIKEIWQWELADDHWSLLRTEFPILARERATSREERFAALEKLSSKQRADVDLFAQNKILEEKPELLKHALQAAQRKTKELRLSSKGASSPFALESHAQLMSYLDKSALAGQRNPPVEAIASQQKLLCYSEDGEHYYSIAVLTRDDSKSVLTFVQANGSGILDQMLLKRLEELYPEARKKDPATFQNADGSFKPLREVQEAVGKYAFADMLRAIEKEYAQHFGVQPTAQQKQGTSFYVTYRSLSFLKEAEQHLKVQPEDSKWVALSDSKTYLRELEKQWLLTKSEREIPLSDETLFSTKQLQDVAEGGWSNVLLTKNGTLCFFHTLRKEESGKVPSSEEKKIKEILLTQAKSQLVEDLLKRISDRGAIKLLSKENAVL